MVGFSQSPFGFHINLENGWTVSIQFGAGNYSSNRQMDWKVMETIPYLESNTAEIAAWVTEHRTGDERFWWEFEDGQEVKGWQTHTEVIAFINDVSKMRQIKSCGCWVHPDEMAKAPWEMGDGRHNVRVRDGVE